VERLALQADGLGIPAWYGLIFLDTPYPSNSRREPIMSMVPRMTAGR
jgi:hypothetical protein